MSLDKINITELKSNRIAQKQFYYFVYENLFHIPKRYYKTTQQAEEIFNDAMIKIFASIERAKDIENMLGWCSRIIFTTTIDKLRKEIKHSERIEYTDDLPIVASSIGNILDKLEADELFGFIQRLPQKQLAVFSLFEIDGFSHKEIADTLGISSTNSKYILSKAKEELRRTVLKNRIKIYN